jgi:hypothetical protein
MDTERRRAIRRAFIVECSWTRGARITDLSALGCYVDTHVAPRVGETVEFNATIDDHTVQFRGTAVTATPGVGFGVEFGGLPEETTEVLLAVLEKAARHAT